MSDTESDYDYENDPDNLLNPVIDSSFKTDKIFGISPLSYSKNISDVSKMMSGKKTDHNGTDSQIRNILLLFYCFGGRDKQALFFIPIYASDGGEKNIQYSVDNDNITKISDIDSVTEKKTDHEVSKISIFTKKYFWLGDRDKNKMYQDIQDDMSKHNIYVSMLNNIFCGKFEPKNMVNVRNLARSEHANGKLKDEIFFHPDCGFAYDTKTDSAYLLGETADGMSGEESKTFTYGVSVYNTGYISGKNTKNILAQESKIYYELFFCAELQNSGKEIYEIDGDDSIYAKNYFLWYDEIFEKDKHDHRIIASVPISHQQNREPNQQQSRLMHIDTYYKTWNDIYQLSSYQYPDKSLYEHNNTQKYWIPPNDSRKVKFGDNNKISVALRTINICLNGKLNKIGYIDNENEDQETFVINLEKISFLVEEYYTTRYIFPKISENKEMLELDKFGKVHVKNISSDVRLPIPKIRKVKKEKKEKEDVNDKKGIESIPELDVQNFEELPDFDFDTNESPFEAAGYSSSEYESNTLGHKYVISLKSKIFSGKTVNDVKNDIIRGYSLIAKEFSNNVGWYIEKMDPMIVDIPMIAPKTLPDTYIRSISLEMDSELCGFYGDKDLSNEESKLEKWIHKIIIYVKSSKIEPKTITKLVSDSVSKIHEYLSVVWLVNFYKRSGVFKHLAPNDLEKISGGFYNTTNTKNETQTILMSSKETGSIDSDNKSQTEQSPVDTSSSVSFLPPTPPPPPIFISGVIPQTSSSSNYGDGSVPPPPPPMFGGVPPPPPPPGALGGGPPPPPGAPDGILNLIPKGNEVSRFIGQKTYDIIQNALKFVGFKKPTQKKEQKKPKITFKKASKSFFVEILPLIWWNIPGNKKGESISATNPSTQKIESFSFPSQSAVSISGIKTSNLEDIMLDIENVMQDVVMSYPPTKGNGISVGMSLSELMSSPIHGIAIVRICTKIQINEFKKHSHRILTEPKENLDKVNYDTLKFIMTDILKNSSADTFKSVLMTYIDDYLNKFILKIENPKTSDRDFVETFLDFMSSFCIDNRVLEKCKNMDYVRLDKGNISPLSLLFQSLIFAAAKFRGERRSLFNMVHNDIFGSSDRVSQTYVLYESYEILKDICIMYGIDHNSVDDEIDEVSSEICNIIPKLKEKMLESLTEDHKKYILDKLYKFFYKDNANSPSFEGSIHESIDNLSKNFENVVKFICGGFNSSNDLKKQKIKKPENTLDMLNTIFGDIGYFPESVLFELYLFSQFDVYGSTDFVIGNDQNLNDSQKSSMLFQYLISRVHGLPDIVYHFSKGISTYSNLHSLFAAVSEAPTTISSSLYPESGSNGLVEQLERIDNLRLSLGLIPQKQPNTNYIYDRFIYKSNKTMKLGFTNHKLRHWTMVFGELKPFVYEISKDIMELTDMLNLLNEPFVKTILHLWTELHMINSKKIVPYDVLLQEFLRDLSSNSEKKIKDFYDILLYSLISKFKREENQGQKEMSPEPTKIGQQEKGLLDYDVFSGISISDIEESIIKTLRTIYSNERENYLTQLITLPKIGKGKTQQYLEKNAINGKTIEIRERGVSIPSRLLNFETNNVNNKIREVETEAVLVSRIFSPEELIIIEEEAKKKREEREKNASKKVTNSDESDKESENGEKQIESPIMSSVGSIVNIYEKMMAFYPSIFRLIPIYFVSGRYYQNFYFPSTSGGIDSSVIRSLFTINKEFISRWDGLIRIPKPNNKNQKKSVRNFDSKGFVPDLYNTPDMLYWNSFSKIFIDREFYNISSPDFNKFGPGGFRNVDNNRQIYKKKSDNSENNDINKIKNENNDKILQLEYLKTYLKPLINKLPGKNAGNIFGTGTNFVVDVGDNVRALVFKNHMKKIFPDSPIFDYYYEDNITLRDYYNVLIRGSTYGIYKSDDDTTIVPDIKKYRLVVGEMITSEENSHKNEVNAYEICIELEKYIRDEHFKKINTNNIPQILINGIKSDIVLTVIPKISKTNAKYVIGNVAAVDCLANISANILEYFNMKESKTFISNISSYDHLMYYGRFLDRFVNMLHFRESNLLCSIIKSITIYQLAEHSTKITNESIVDLSKSVKLSQVEMIKLAFKNCVLFSDLKTYKEGKEKPKEGTFLNLNDIKTYEFLCLSNFILGNE